jgi:type I restriction enzyme, S subunit
MIAGVKPYPKYRDSSVEWIGQMPDHWAVQPSKTLLSSVTGGSWGSDPGTDAVDALCIRGTDFNHVLLTADITKAPTRSFSENDIRRRSLHQGDLVLSTSGGNSAQAVGAVVRYLAHEVALPTNFAARLSPLPNVNSRFLTYLYYSMNKYGLTKRLTNQVTIANLDLAQYLRIPVPLPPLSEQAAIVRFLDHADQRIRQYIAAKKKLTALLNEQKQAIRHRAVTRGLDPSVRLKPSGVEWLGDVPEHWTIMPNKAVMTLRRRTVGTRSTDFTLLSLTLRGIIPRDLENPEGKFPADFGTYQVVEPGELVFCLFDMDETPRTVGIAHELGMVTGAYSAFTCIDQDVADFLYDFYLAMDAQKRLRPFYTGLRKVIQHGTFLSIKVAIPPTAELREILSLIATEMARIDSALARTEREVDLVREYRTRLIADVVTGKLDVRDAAARLPDEAEEPEPLDDMDALREGDGPEDEVDLNFAAGEAEA